MHPLRFYLKARWNSESECLNKVWQRFNDREKTMKFLDQAKIYVKSGDGGAGCVSFRRTFRSGAVRPRPCSRPPPADRSEYVLPQGISQIPLR